MKAYRPFVAYFVASVASAAVLSYLDAYHFNVNRVDWKFPTPAAVFKFQMGIWVPLAAIGATIYFVAYWLANGRKSIGESAYFETLPALVVGAFSSLLVYGLGKLFPHTGAGVPIVFLLVVVCGFVAGRMSSRSPTLKNND